MIEAQNLKKKYGALSVVNGINLSVQRGEFVTIVGKSGAGKSTLLHILGTLDNADSGTLRIAGTDVQKFKGNALADFRNKNIGFIFQFHHLLPEFTALENVMMPAQIAKIPESQARKRAMELLDLLSLAERATHKPNQMSGGEQQRVAVARAIMNAPAVIFADEPSGNLDSALSNELHNYLFKLRKELNQTFVIVTHNQELANMSDRRLTMRDGQIFDMD